MPWQKGQSGNPLGRLPGEKLFADQLRMVLAEVADPVYGIVKSQGLNVREEPSRHAPILDAISSGQRVTIISPEMVTHDWLLIETKDNVRGSRGTDHCSQGVDLCWAPTPRCGISQWLGWPA